MTTEPAPAPAVDVAALLAAHAGPRIGAEWHCSCGLAYGPVNRGIGQRREIEAVHAQHQADVLAQVATHTG